MGKVFTPVTEPVGFNFFKVCQIFGRKHVHILGYCYRSSSNEYVSKDNPDGTFWWDVEVCGFWEPVEEFVRHIKEDPCYVDNFSEECKQYSDDITKEEMAERINRYFDGKGADSYLAFGEITAETPYGDYVN